MPTLDYAQRLRRVRGDRRFCDCQQGRTSVFLQHGPVPGHICQIPRVPTMNGTCAVNRCRPHACLCKCHRDSTRESGEDFLTEDFRKEASE